MYMNLHVQTRARWTSDLIIYAEAEDLFHRIGLAQQNNQTITHTQNMNNIAMISTVTLPIEQLLLIQSALLRM